MAHQERLPECEQRFKGLDGELADMKKPRSTTWLQYLVGVIVSLILFIVLPTMVNYSIEADKESRMRDSDLEKRHTESEQKQASVNSALLSTLSEIRTDLKWLMKNQKGG
jgi:hypothetical protein